MVSTSEVGGHHPQHSIYGAPDGLRMTLTKQQHPCAQEVCVEAAYLQAKGAISFEALEARSPYYLVSLRRRLMRSEKEEERMRSGPGVLAAKARRHSHEQRLTSGC